MEVAFAAVVAVCRQGRNGLFLQAAAAAPAPAVRRPSASIFACPVHWARRPSVPSLSCHAPAVGQQNGSVRLFAGSARTPKQERRPLRAVTSGDVRLDRFGRSYEEFRKHVDEKRRRRRRRLYLIAGGAAFGFGWYYVTHLETVPFTGRQRFLSVTPSQEEELAKAAYRQVMGQFGRQVLHQSHPYTLMVRRVAQRLVKVSGVKNFNWEVYVVNSPERNAFVLPGGKIFVFTGILPMCANEDGLAAVLAHEIAHQLARHSAEKFSNMKLLLIFQVFFGLLFDPGLILNQMIMTLGFMLPFSRKCELEADQIGLKLMAQACYDPKAAVDVFHRMTLTIDKEPLQYLSTHPGHKTRLRNFDKWLPEAERLREESDCTAELSNLASMAQILDVPRW